MQPKYEEKTFESYFNTELDRKSSVYYPFGQVQEGSIGADSSAFTRSRWLWGLLGYPYLFNAPFQGEDLRELANHMEHELDKVVKNIPSIKVNLLLQYKRPEHIGSKLGSEWKHWNRSYFRYDIYSDQQELLEKLVTRCGQQVLVLYASPALKDVEALVEAKLNNKIIESTNFTPAMDLANHHRNTYIKSGRSSIACSEPEELKGFDLLAELEEFQGDHQSEFSNFDKIVKFTKEVRSIGLESPLIGKAYQSELNQYIEAGISEYPLYFSIISMKIFRELSGIQWSVPIAA